MAIHVSLPISGWPPSLVEDLDEPLPYVEQVAGRGAESVQPVPLADLATLRSQ